MYSILEDIVDNNCFFFSKIIEATLKVQTNEHTLLKNSLFIESKVTKSKRNFPENVILTC